MDLVVDVTKKWPLITLRADLAYTGRRLGCFGPSGCGKSTLASILAGLVAADRGSIRLDGRTLEDTAARIRVPPEKRRIGMVFQKAALFPHLSVCDNLLYGYHRIPGRVCRLDPDKVVDRLELAPLLARFPATLSGGERQRVAMGRAVLASPRLLIMDEPVSALDEETRYPTLRFMREVCGEWDIPYIFISHSVLEMRLMTDKVMLLMQGCIQGLEAPEELARRQAGASPAGYSNLLTLISGEQQAGLWRYRWGENDLLLTDRPRQHQDGPLKGVVASKDVVLFKEHPRAISARNLLACRVQKLWPGLATCGVVLDCRRETLIAEVVHAAAEELELRPGQTVYAAIKASAIRVINESGVK